MKNHRLMATFQPSPYSKKHLEYTASLARFLSCEWFAVYIKPAGNLSQFETELLESNEKTARSLGAEIIVIESEKIAESLQWACTQNLITHIILGQSDPKVGNRFFSRSIEKELQRKCRGIDITVLSPDENITMDQENFLKSKGSFLSRAYSFMNLSLFPFTIVVVNLLTLLNLVLIDWMDYRSLGMIYILGINLCALYTTRFSIVLAAVLSSAAWNYLFIPPRFTFHIHSKEDWLMELMFLVAAFVIGRFSQELKDKEFFLMTESRRKANLYSLLKEFSKAKGLDKNIQITKDFILKLTGVNPTIYLLDSDQDISFLQLNQIEEEALGWVLVNKIEAGRLANNYGHLNYWFIPLKSSDEMIGVVILDLSGIRNIDIDKKIYVDAALNQLIVAIDRDRLYLENSKNKIALESQKITNALLSSVSHELRTPLASIKGFASALLFPQKNKSVEFNKEVGEEIVSGVERLELVVQNLLDMSRLESGYFKIKRDIVDLSELIFSATLKIQKRFPGRKIIIRQPDYSIFTLGDFILLQQVLENVLGNACIYSQLDVVINCYDRNNHIFIEVLDEGIGILNTQRIFEKFYRERPQVPGGTGLGLSICKNFLEMHNGFIEVENRPNGGSLFRIVLIKEQIVE